MKNRVRGKKQSPPVFMYLDQNKHIYAQVIDDNKNITITSSSSICPN